MIESYYQQIQEILSNTVFQDYGALGAAYAWLTSQAAACIVSMLIALKLGIKNS